MKILLWLILTVFCTQIFAGRKKLLKRIGIDKKNCEKSKVKNVDALLKAGCWRLYMFNKGTCVFTSPCDGHKNRKFNCRNSPGGFCRLCHKCTCKERKADCEVSTGTCTQQIISIVNKDEGCFVQWGKMCHYVFPCPTANKECEIGDTKCVDCNLCTCHEGKYRCTMKTCPQCPGNCWGTATNQSTCECKTKCDGNSNFPKVPCNNNQFTCKACAQCACSSGSWKCNVVPPCPSCPSDCWVIDNTTGGCTCKPLCS